MLRDVAELLRSIAWPATLLVLVFSLRSEAKALIAVFSEKLDRATRFKISKSGIELADEITRTLTRSGAGERVGTPEEIKAQLETLVSKYDNLPIVDRSERVAARMRIADELGSLASKLKLSRSGLSEAKSEGKLVTLATLCIQTPQASDLALLERAARTANFRFTRYRIALALLPILGAPVIGAKILDRAAGIVKNLESASSSAPDDDLQSLIDRLYITIGLLRSTLA